MTDTPEEKKDEGNNSEVDESTKNKTCENEGKEKMETSDVKMNEGDTENENSDDINKTDDNKKVDTKDESVVNQTLENNGETETKNASESKATPVDVQEKNDELLKNVADRLKFFFSNANLRSDRYMREQLMARSDESVLIRDLLRFRTIQNLTQSADVIRVATKKFASGFLSLNKDESGIARVNKFDLTVDFKETIVGLTLVVENLPTRRTTEGRTMYNCTVPEVKELFEPYGCVTLVRFRFGKPLFRLTENERRHLEMKLAKKNRKVEDRPALGVAFVEFDSESTLANVLDAMPLFNKDKNNRDLIKNNNGVKSVNTTDGISKDDENEKNEIRDSDVNTVKEKKSDAVKDGVEKRNENNDEDVKKETETGTIEEKIATEDDKKDDMDVEIGTKVDIENTAEEGQTNSEMEKDVKAKNEACLEGEKNDDIDVSGSPDKTEKNESKHLKLKGSVLFVQSMKQWSEMKNYKERSFKKINKERMVMDGSKSKKRSAEGARDSGDDGTSLELPEITIEWEKGCVVALKGLPDGCDREAIFLTLEEFDKDAERPYVDYSRGQTDGALRFQTPNPRTNELVSGLKSGTFKICGEKIGDALLLEGEEEEKYWDAFKKFKREKMMQNALIRKKRKFNHQGRGRGRGRGNFRGGSFRRDRHRRDR